MRHVNIRRSVATHEAYLAVIGVPQISHGDEPFDPGYDPATFESHLDQSAHLISILKLSMACWIIAREECTRRKVAAAKKHGVPTVYRRRAVRNRHQARAVCRPIWILCADIGVTRVECGQGFIELELDPKEIVAQAAGRGLDVQFELGKKTHRSILRRQPLPNGSTKVIAGSTPAHFNSLSRRGKAPKGSAYSTIAGACSQRVADYFAEAFGLKTVVLRGPEQAEPVRAPRAISAPLSILSNVRLEELLRVRRFTGAVFTRTPTQSRISSPDTGPTLPRGSMPQTVEN
jgi:phosphosulfolactate synthase